MIVVKVSGGIGNQMFQYAFYLFQQLNNEEVYLDISDFDIHKHHYGYELEKVFSNLQIKTLSKKELGKIRLNKNLFLHRFIKKIFNVQVMKDSEFREVPASFLANQYKYNKDIYFDGYWISKYYVDCVSETLREHLVFRNLPNKQNISLLKEIKSRMSVSVHIRRGDFLKIKELSSAVTIDYYEKAFKYFKKIEPDSLFVVFSDDIAWAKTNINFSTNIIFVDWNCGENSYMDMQMMSCCNHHIIANSSFSWWGAWLNDNNDKIVLAPKVWNSEAETRNNLIYENWKVI